MDIIPFFREIDDTFLGSIQFWVVGWRLAISGWQLVDCRNQDSQDYRIGRIIEPS